MTKIYPGPERTESGRKMSCLEMRLANGKTGEAQELSPAREGMTREGHHLRALSPDSAKTDGGIVRQYCR